MPLAHKIIHLKQSYKDDSSSNKITFLTEMSHEVEDCVSFRPIPRWSRLYQFKPLAQTAGFVTAGPVDMEEQERMGHITE